MRFPATRFLFFVLLGSTSLLGVACRRKPVPAELAPFRVPNESERRAALGPVEELPPALRSALEAQVFHPVPAPGPGDWLESIPERGQTFAQFIASKANRPEGARRVLYLQPLRTKRGGEVPSLEFLRAYSEAFFGLPVRIQSAVSLDRANIKERHLDESSPPQLLTGDLLALLGGAIPPDGFCVLGLTMEDLYPGDDFNFVFGQASLSRRVGVYSFVRYSPAFYGAPMDAKSKRLELLRASKVLAHETGHMFGLHHCIYYRCVMNGSNHLAELDSGPVELCPVCLRKLQWSVGFDVAVRARRLRDEWKRAGFADVAAWFDARLARIEAADGADRAAQELPAKPSG